MNSLYRTAVEGDHRSGLIILSIVPILLISVLAFQCSKFYSSLWVLLQFGYDEWQSYLLPMLGSLFVWAIIDGVYFSLQFFIAAPEGSVQKALIGAGAGFVIGVLFVYFLVLVMGIVIFIPLGILSLVFPDVIQYATLAFTWLIASYIVLFGIAVDTPSFMIHIFQQANWYWKFVLSLVGLWLTLRILMVIVAALQMILKTSVWQRSMEAFILAIGVSLIITVVVNILLIRRENIRRILLTIIVVYLASIFTGNISEEIVHWGEWPSAIAASFFGPIAYSLAAKFLLRHGVMSFISLIGLHGGLLIGLFIDQWTHLRIIGQGWSGILCGTLITIGLGVSLGVIFGNAITDILVHKLKVNPVVGYLFWSGTIVGVVFGMVCGGFAAR